MDIRAHVSYGRQLQTLVGLLVAGCLLYFPRSKGPLLTDVPEIVIPLCITIVLAVTSIWIHNNEFFCGHLREIVRFGWAGAIISAITSVWWVVVRRAPSIQIQSLSDEVLTVWSLGIGAGILVGTYTAMEVDSRAVSGRKTALTEVPWTGRSAPDGILEAVAEALGAVEDVDPLELDPLWRDIDPDVFSVLQSRDGAQWQLRFFRDEYEIRISSQGVVTVYDAEASTPDLEILVDRELAKGVQ